MSGRKFEAIDLMKLKALGSHKGWNEMLADCLDKRDINRLAKIRYSLQAGMADLVKSKLNSDDNNAWFLRLNKSIEDTAKKVIRRNHPLPGDNPLLAKSASTTAVQAKKLREAELDAFMKKSSY